MVHPLVLARSKMPIQGFHFQPTTRLEYLHHPLTNFPVTTTGVGPIWASRVKSPLNPPLRSTSGGDVFPRKSSKGMSVWHEMELQVKVYELDQYGVVNNAVYSNYCQHGHYELGQKIGVGADPVAKTGEALALTELSFKFFAPLMGGDRFIHKVRISNMTIARVFFQHVIVKQPSNQVIFEANATAVWLDKNYCPVRIPLQVREQITQFIREAESTNSFNGQAWENMLA